MGSPRAQIRAANTFPPARQCLLLGFPRFQAVTILARLVGRHSKDWWPPACRDPLTPPIPSPPKKVESAGVFVLFTEWHDGGVENTLTNLCRMSDHHAHIPTCTLGHCSRSSGEEHELHDSHIHRKIAYCQVVVFVRCPLALRAAAMVLQPARR